MRKRKSPIALITVLVVMASVAFGLQYVNGKGASPADAPPAPPQTDAQAVGAPRAGTSASEVSAGVKSAMTSPKREAMPPGEGGPMGAPGAGGSMILRPAPSSAKPEKPKPNSSSTSTQWYNDKSALSSDKG